MGSVPMTLEQEIANWHRRRWPTFWPDGQLNVFAMGTKLAEEVGETCGALVKMRDGTGRQTVSDLKGEVGDVLLCLAVIAHEHGFTLGDAVMAKVEEHVRR